MELYPNIKRGTKVLVAMSGGLDSSITALLLHEAGFECIGITMKTWDYVSSGVVGSGTKTTGCCSLDDINDARQLCVDYGIPHNIIDIREVFTDSVVNNFVDEYMAGRTPNPCIVCNTHIKWGVLLNYADQLDCEYIATGHYARIRQENDRYVISSGIDGTKDQSYVLYGLSQEVLARTLVPMGEYLKSDIRDMAKERGYDAIATKSESYEICFVPTGHFSDFLKFKRPELAHLDGGEIRLKDETVIGTHHGYPFYTVGQRRGLGVSTGNVLYVNDIDPNNNVVYVGGEEELNKTVVYVKDFNFIKYPSIEDGFECVVKIRYKDRGSHARLYNAEDGLIRVEFLKEVKAPTLGQSAVAVDYDGDVIGGGIMIKRM